MSHKKHAALLMGPPGSGKTTVARALGAEEDFTIIETGNILRAEAKRGSALGREIIPYQAAGNLVPSDLVKRVILSELEKSPEASVLFDGFPRNATQVELLWDLLKERDLELCSIFIFNIDQEVVLKRLSGRRVCQNCGTLYNIFANPPRHEGKCDKCNGPLIQRPDDKPEVVSRRFENYEHETVPINDLFRKEYADLCVEVPAEAAPTDVAAQLRRELTRAFR